MHLHPHTHSTPCHHHHHHFFSHTTRCHCPVVLVLICPCTYTLTCVVAPTTATFSCALCPSQPCPSTTELSPCPTTLPSHQQPHAHIHDPFFITWVGLKGTINNFTSKLQDCMSGWTGIRWVSWARGVLKLLYPLNPSISSCLNHLCPIHSLTALCSDVWMCHIYYIAQIMWTTLFLPFHATWVMPHIICSLHL